MHLIKDENGNLIINEDEAKVVRMIFRLYLDGNGAHRIAKILNTSGITTVTGGRWYESTIRQMLKNEKYKGDCLLQKYYVPKVGGGTVVNKGELQSYYVADNHEPIISKEDREVVQRIREKRARESRTAET